MRPVAWGMLKGVWERGLEGVLAKGLEKGLGTGFVDEAQGRRLTPTMAIFSMGLVDMVKVIW